MAFGTVQQGQQQGVFDQQGLFQQFMMEMLGQAPPSPPFSGGGKFAPGQVQNGQVLPVVQQVQQPQQQPQQQQQQPHRPQQQQQQAPQQSEPLTPAPQPVQPQPQPQLQPVQPVQPVQPIMGAVPGLFPSAFGGVGQTISGTSTPANVLSNALFG